jgi:hypothetical protein
MIRIEFILAADRFSPRMCEASAGRDRDIEMKLGIGSPCQLLGVAHAPIRTFSFAPNARVQVAFDLFAMALGTKSRRLFATASPMQLQRPSPFGLLGQWLGMRARADP